MLILGRFSKLFSFLGEIMAFLTIAIIGLLYLNEVLPIHFLGDFAEKLIYIKEYAVILTLTMCGLSFASRHSLILFIPFCILAVASLACYSIIVIRL